MKRLAFTAAVFAASLAGVLHAAPKGNVSPKVRQQIVSTELSGSDLAFFAEASRRTALLARLSELAKSHAVTPEVQNVAASILKEQTDAVACLNGMAESKHVPLPEERDGKGTKQLQDLAKLKGAKFDKTYLDALSDAQDALETSLQAGAISADKDIKAYAKAGLETLKQERERVRKLGL